MISFSHLYLYFHTYSLTTQRISLKGFLCTRSTNTKFKSDNNFESINIIRISYILYLLVLYKTLFYTINLRLIIVEIMPQHLTFFTLSFAAFPLFFTETCICANWRILCANILLHLRKNKTFICAKNLPFICAKNLPFICANYFYDCVPLPSSVNIVAFLQRSVGLHC